MNLNRSFFAVMLLLTPLLALFCCVAVDITSAVYSDLAPYGIRYGSEPFITIVHLTQKQMLLVTVPLAVFYALAMVGWGFTLYRWSHDKRSPATAGAERRG